MGDALTITDLETAKKHDTFHSEVITGKAGGLASGVDIDTATNAVTGQAQTTMPKVLRDVGFKPASFNFVTGGTLGLADADKCIYNPAPSGDDNWYSWGGNLPHTVAPGADPAAVGSGYVPRTDVILRSDLASESGSELVGYQPAGTGAVATTVQSKLRETVSVFDFMTAAQISDVKARTQLLDVTDALQACADYALYSARDVIINLPSGTYKTSRPWQLGYGVLYNGTPYVSVHVVGPGLGRGPFDSAVIAPNFSNAPGVVIQGALGAKLEGFAIKGKNRDHIYSTVLDTSHAPRTTIDQRVVGNWIDPSLAANANSRYAPYAGIAIDPYSNSAPATAYPNVIYPAFLGSVSQYNKVQGSFFTFEDMQIEGFVDAISVSPNGDSGQSDFVSIKRSWIQGNVYALTTNGPNARVSHFDGCYVNDGFAAIANSVRGSQNGTLEGTHINSAFDRLMYILAPGTISASAREVAFSGCHGENLWAVGDFISNAKRTGFLIIDGCSFQFGWQAFQHIGKPAYELKLGNSPLNIRGAQLWGVSRLFRIDGDPSVISVDNAYFEPSDATTPNALYKKVAHTTFCGIHIFQDSNPPKKPANFSARNIVSYGFDGSANFVRNENRVQPSYGRNQPLCYHLSDMNVGGKIITSKLKFTQVAKSSLASVSLSGTTLTFDYTGRSDADFELYGPAPGDVIYDGASGSVFYVRSRTGTVVTAELQNNYAVVGGTVTLINSFSTTSGLMWFCVGRMYAPASYLKGNLTSGSATITNCGISNGQSNFIGEIRAGDRLYTNVFDNYYANNDNARTKVSSVDTGTGVIAMGDSMAVTLTNQHLAFWVVPPLENA